tara:strand:- start:9 stop:356 length:348 start_codon:yes stop_codon:yes gene_type:complete
MTITQDFLSQCSDDQINKGVAWLTIKEWGYGNKHKRKSIDYFCSQGLLNSVTAGNVNYCNNPNDAWPIILENEMLIRPVFDDSGYWMAQMYQTHTHSKNPLRAAMEVYILMSVAK